PRWRATTRPGYRTALGSFKTRVTGRNGEGVACCEHRRPGESQEGGWDSTPADVRSIDGHDERVPNQQIRVGEGSSTRLRSLYRRDLDREAGRSASFSRFLGLSGPVKTMV